MSATPVSITVKWIKITPGASPPKVFFAGDVSGGGTFRGQFDLENTPAKLLFLASLIGSRVKGTSTNLQAASDTLWHGEFRWPRSHYLVQS